MYMKPIRYISLISVLFLTFALVPAERSEAQWGVGASYESRDEHPNNGFGLRLERKILQAIPLADVSIRAHASFFSEDIDSYGDAGTLAELDSYDFGLAARGGISLGLLSPYVGLGLGSEHLEAVREGAQQGSFENNSLYWNIFTGAEFSMIPLVKPFVEYRFSKMFDDEEMAYGQNGRWAIGLTLEF